MIVSSHALTKHLRRISCRGLIDEVVLLEDFAAKAMTVDHIFASIVPPFDEAEPLPHPIGIIGLKRLIRTIDYMGQDTGQVNLSYNLACGKLVVACREYGAVHLVTGSPSIIGTSMQDHVLDVILEHVPTQEYFLPWRVADQLFKLSEITRSDMVGIRFSATAGRLVIGEPTGDHAILPYDTSRWRGPDFWLTLRTAVLLPVLKQIDDFALWTLRVDGPESIVSISNGEYTYLTSPEDPDRGRWQRWNDLCESPPVNALELLPPATTPASDATPGDAE